MVQRVRGVRIGFFREHLVTCPLGCLIDRMISYRSRSISSVHLRQMTAYMQCNVIGGCERVTFVWGRRRSRPKI